MSRQEFEPQLRSILEPLPNGVDEAIIRLADTTQSVLGDNLASMYLAGSLVCGDFDPDSSDIDFTTIIHEPIGAEQATELQDSYRRLRTDGGWWDSRTEGVFLPAGYCAALPVEASSQHVLKTNGDFVPSLERSDWIIQLHTTRQRGLLLRGHVKIDEIMLEVPSERLREAMRGGAAPFIMRPESSEQIERVTALHVLSACRLAYTYTTGNVGSKPEAAKWATATFPEFKPVLMEAIQKRGSFETAPYGSAYDFIDSVFELLKETHDAPSV